MARLIIFDVDGTLVDSQEMILASMTGAFAAVGLERPPREAVLGIVGLSLVPAMAALRPDQPEAVHIALAEAYKAAYRRLRETEGADALSPFFPGALAALDRLGGQGHLLGIATGKARRGLEHMLDGHGLRPRFAVTQTADDAPSKPHPGMVLNCLVAAGVAPTDAVVIGDTEFDMAMARAAGAHAVGVAWGYHDRARLERGGAGRIVESFEVLDAALEALWIAA